MRLSSPSVCFFADVFGEQPFGTPVAWALEEVVVLLLSRMISEVLSMDAQIKPTGVSWILGFSHQIYKLVDSTKLSVLSCGERQRSSLVSATCTGEKHKWHRCHVKALVCLFSDLSAWVILRVSFLCSCLVLAYTLPFQVCLVFIHFKYLCTEIAP